MHQYIWIDAQTGEVLLDFNQQPDAQDRRIYTASNTETLPGSLVRSEGQPAHWRRGRRCRLRVRGRHLQLLLDQHGRDSVDGAGQPLVLTVHYGVNYENAFWDQYAEQMGFGDGVALADDVVAHEITHGVTQHTANLYYYKQSGALNESFSDIFGETVDLTNGAGNGYARRCDGWRARTGPASDRSAT